jgi:seryl-tRNA synthetase
MPLDIALLRNSPEVVKESQVRRFKDPAVVDQILKLNIT